jgi:predicted  nucleic acid-binding Zn ribbon protein
MQVVQLTFVTEAVGDQDIELIERLLHHWRCHGQILGREQPIAQSDTSYIVSVVLPEPMALDPVYDGQYAALTREKLRAAGICGPLMRPMEPAATGASAACKCSNRASFLLFTTYVQLASCLSCGDCFQPVPLYRVPTDPPNPQTGELHDRLMNWQSNYQACDRLQMNCQVGEKFGLREMGQHNSALSRQGIAICQDISRLTGTPTYYYLHRYLRRARAAVEQQRRCPGCSGNWRLPERAHIFDFRCDECRLMSCMSP